MKIADITNEQIAKAIADMNQRLSVDWHFIARKGETTFMDIGDGNQEVSINAEEFSHIIGVESVDAKRIPEIATEDLMAIAGFVTSGVLDSIFLCENDVALVSFTMKDGQFSLNIGAETAAVQVQQA